MQQRLRQWTIAELLFLTLTPTVLANEGEPNIIRGSEEEAGSGEAARGGNWYSITTAGRGQFLAKE